MKQNNLDIKKVLEIIKGNNLTTLDLSPYKQFGDEELKQIAEILPENTSITTIKLDNTCITDQGLNFLAEAFKNNIYITAISLSNIWSNPQSAIIYALTSGSTSKVENNDLSEVIKAQILIYLKRNRTLRALRNQEEAGTKVIKLEFNKKILSNKISLIALARVLEKNPDIQDVFMSDIALTDDIIVEFINALEKNTNITTFWFARDWTKLELLEKIDGYIYRNRMSKLLQSAQNMLISGKLFIENEEITSEGAPPIIDLLNNPTNTVPITSISLIDTKIGRKGIEQVIEALKNQKHLAELNLSGNFLYEEGAEALAEFIDGNQTLEVIHLQNCRINLDKTFTLARALETNQKIKIFNLKDNVISIRGAQAFAEAILKNTTLEKLELPSPFQKMIDSLMAINKDVSGLPFCKAASEGNSEMVEYLYFAGMDIEQQDENGNTPLCLAVKKGHDKIVEFLITQGANTNHLNHEGKTLYALASSANIKAILEKAASIPYWLQKCLADIKNPKILKIDLSAGYIQNFWVNNQHVRIICQALQQNGTIKLLNLSNNQIGETGALFIKDLLKTNKTITAIDLRDNCPSREIRFETWQAIESALLENYRRRTEFSGIPELETVSTNDNYSLFNGWAAWFSSFRADSTQQTYPSDIQQVGKAKETASKPTTQPIMPQTPTEQPARADKQEISSSEAGENTSTESAPIQQSALSESVNTTVCKDSVLEKEQPQVNLDEAQRNGMKYSMS